MNPNQLKKKREALSMEMETGLESTMIHLESDDSVDIVHPASLKPEWFFDYKIPTVRVNWQSNRFQASELFYCPDQVNPN
jgi:hypothetical protein